MKKHLPVLLIGFLLGGGIIWLFASHPSGPTDVMLRPPTDSGFALIQVNQRAAITTFAYKFGEGSKARYQFVYSETKMDTLKWKGKNGKDSTQLMPRMGANGYAEQVETTPIVDQKYVLAWYPKPR